MKLQVDTYWDLDSCQIIQELKHDHQVIMRNILQTREEGARKALIALGWTLPNDGL